MKKNIWFSERKARLHQHLARYPCIHKTAKAVRNIASSAAPALTGAFVLSMLIPAAFAVEAASTTLTTVLNTLTTYVKLAGGVLCVWGAVVLAEHQRANSLGVQYAPVYIMNGSIAGGIYLPAVGSGTVSHMKVKVTTQSVSSYLHDPKEFNVG